MSALPRPQLPLSLLLKLLTFAWLMLLVGIPLQAHADSSISNTAQPYRVLGKPTVNATLINRVLLAYHSPAAGKGQALYDDGVKYGIDPVFALAFFLHESTLGTAGVARVTHSLGNIRCTPDYPLCFHSYRIYASWEDGFDDWYKLIRDVYLASGLTTVEQIIPVYAPATENDVHAYVATVEQAVDTWRAADTSSTKEVIVQKEARVQKKVIVRKVTVPLQIIPSPVQQQDGGDGRPVQLP